MKINRPGSDNKTMRAMFTLALAAAFTLPLQGCNEDVPVAEPFDATTTEPPVRALVEALDATTKASVIRGARLYDNWFTEGGKVATDLAPANPMAKFIVGYFSTTVPYTGFILLGKADQYRCGTCHGYDYVGVEFYGGSLLDIANSKTLAEIIAVIKDGKTRAIEGRDVVVHNFGASSVPANGRLTAIDITDLANFVKYGVVNMEDYLYPFTAVGNGNSTKGETLFGVSKAGCAGGNCHGLDGKFRNFSSTNVVEYVGTLGQDDPAEMLHKVRFGNGGTPEMPSPYSSSTLGFTTQDAVDIMTYTQKLQRQ